MHNIILVYRHRSIKTRRTSNLYRLKMDFKCYYNKTRTTVFSVDKIVFSVFYRCIYKHERVGIIDTLIFRKVEN